MKKILLNLMNNKIKIHRLSAKDFDHHHIELDNHHLNFIRKCFFMKSKQITYEYVQLHQVQFLNPHHLEVYNFPMFD
jgi:hypothetical protein